MNDTYVDKLNADYVISLYATYDEDTKLYDDRTNWGLPACVRCRYSSECPYYKYDPYNKSSCIKFKWEGSAIIDLILKKIPEDRVSGNNYHNFKTGSVRSTE